MISSRSYLTNLQILRFIAAVMVLYWHLLLETGFHRIPLMETVNDTTGIYWASGVDLFFVISGFIMYYLTADKFGSVANALKFLERRAIRVVPLYWLFTILMILAMIFLHDSVHNTDLSLNTIISSFFFFPAARTNGLVQPILGLGWTLEYEIFFYICFSIVLLNKKIVGLSALVAGFVMLSILNHFIPKTMVAFKFWSDPIIVEFLLGMLLAHAYMEGPKFLAINTRFVQLGGVISSVILMIIMSQFKFFDRWIWAGIPATVLAASLILGPTLPIRVLAMGGDASYSLYLSHPFTLNLLAMVWRKFHFLPNGAIYIAAGLISCIFVSFAVHYWIEIPMLTILRDRFFTNRKQNTAPSVSTT